MQRGANVALTREIPGLAGVVVGVRWDAGSESALADALVFATFLCDASGRVRDSTDFVFFNQLSSPEESVSQRDTALGGDSEQVVVDFAAVPAAIDRVVFAVYVNDGIGGRRGLGQLRSCVVRVLNAADNTELVRSEELVRELGPETGLALGEVYRHQGGWKFKVLGAAYSTGITGLASDYGLAL